MIEVALEPEDFEQAKKLAEEMGTLKKSITNGEGNLAGFLGELAALKVYGGQRVSTHDYDLVLPDGTRADVKTKRTTVVPLPHYECSVAALNTRQECDIYIFVRCDISKKMCWVLGHCDKAVYLTEARFLYKGQRDGDNWFTVKSNCYNMPISKLELPQHGQ